MADLGRKVVLSRPENWDKMTHEEKLQWSREFIAALRKGGKK